MLIGEKEKDNDWMWQSHRQTQLMIVRKGPQTKRKRDVVFAILTKCFIPTPL